ncbi:MAG: hypothetical protein IMZ40_00940 [Bacilli bacterium]|nr:hypothetical protein [Bacilli bacterium]
MSSTALAAVQDNPMILTNLGLDKKAPSEAA